MIGQPAIEAIVGLAGLLLTGAATARLVYARRTVRTRTRLNLNDLRLLLFGLTAAAILLPRAFALGDPPELPWAVLWALATLAAFAVVARRLLADAAGRWQESFGQLVFAAAVLYAVVGWGTTPSTSSLMLSAGMGMGDMTMTTDTPLPTLDVLLLLGCVTAAILELNRASRPGTQTVGAAVLQRLRSGQVLSAIGWMLLSYLLVVLLA